jgi:hypothetical protein
MSGGAYGYHEIRGTLRKIGPMVSGQGPVIDDDVNLTRGQHGPEIKNTEALCHQRMRLGLL